MNDVPSRDARSRRHRSLSIRRTGILPNLLSRMLLMVTRLGMLVFVHVHLL
jgi:hypothetical protein